MRLDEIKQSDEVAELAELIKKRCKPWLIESQNAELTVYRGLRHDSFSGGVSYAIETVNQNRNPKDSPVYVHEFYNKSIREAGKRANRSNSIFTLGSVVTLKKNPEVFGEFSEFVVAMPVGKFNYTWTTAFKDGYEFYEKVLTPYVDDVSGKQYFNIPKELETKIRNSWRGDDGSLSKAIKSRREIMIASKEILYIKPTLYKKVVKYINE